MTDAEYAVYNVEYANVVLDLVRSQMDSLGYLDDQTVTLHITKDANGYFGADDEGMGQVDLLGLV